MACRSNTDTLILSGLSRESCQIIYCLPDAVADFWFVVYTTILPQTNTDFVSVMKCEDYAGILVFCLFFSNYGVCFKGLFTPSDAVTVIVPVTAQVYHCNNDVVHNGFCTLSASQWCITISTMINLDGDGHGDGV